MNEEKNFNILGLIGGFKSFKMKLILYGIGLVLLLFLILVSYFFFEFKLIEPSGDNGPYSDLKPGQGICNLTMPVKVKYRISSLYGYRVPNAKNGSSFHRAIDLAVSSGTDVYAAISGKVSVTRNSSCGISLRIKNSNGEVVRFCHLSQTIAKSGDQVEQGDLVAKSGNTGASSGPHLHFEFIDSTGKKVSLNNLFGYTDLPECINYTGNKPASERKKCNISNSRKMDELAKTQFANACKGILTPIEAPDADEEGPTDEWDEVEETETEETQTEQTNLLGTE